MSNELFNLAEITLALKQLENSSANVNRYIKEWKKIMNEKEFDTFNYEFRETEYLSSKLRNNLYELQRKIEYLYQNNETK